MTAADIARLAGVTRATVSNWRRRHPDFPEPVGGTEASPAYDRAQVEDWLATRGSLPELAPEERLWRRAVHLAGGPGLDSLWWAVSAARGTPGSMFARSLLKEDKLAQELADAAAKSGAQDIVTFLIDKFIEETGKSALATPRPVADLMVRLAVTEGATVLDPACGSGELLASAAAHGAACVLGQDVDPEVADFARLRLSELSGAVTSEFEAGDSLLDDKFSGLRADVVLCHPPFGNRDWGQDALAYDPRWQYGTPPRAEPELAWAQHALARLRPGGRAVMLMPPAAASRSSGRRIRAEMLRRGVIRAVVSLPPGTAYPRHVGVHVWMLERPVDEPCPDPRMLFIDTSAGGGEPVGVKRPPIPWEDIADTILRAWDSFAADGEADQPGTSRAVPVIDLLDDEVDLTPVRHVGTRHSSRSSSEVAATAAGLRTHLREVLAELNLAIPGDDWLPREHQPTWRTATLTELAQTGMALLHRAPAAAPQDAELAAARQAPGSRPVLTAADLRDGSPPRGAISGEKVRPEWVTISVGDVIIPAGLEAPLRTRVAGEGEHGAFLGEELHLIRPDSGRIDPWFLSGFLSNWANARQASYGTTVIRIDARRLMVPLLPLEEQRRYAAAFLRLRGFDKMIHDLAEIAQELSSLLNTSLAQGTLMPAKNRESVILSEHQAYPCKRDVTPDEGKQSGNV